MFIRILERLFVIAMLMYSMHVATALIYPNLGEEDAASVSADIHLPIVMIQAALYGCGALLILTRWRRVLGASLRIWPILLLVALAPLSAAWSVDPMLTLRRSALLIGSAFVGIYFGERFTLDEYARLLMQTFCILMVLSVVLYFVAPRYVLDVTHEGAWRGLADHKNNFGEDMALALILLLLNRPNRLQWLRYLFLGMACAMLLLSRSATSLAAALLVVATLPFWQVVRLSPKPRLAAYIVATATILGSTYVLMANRTAVLTLLGRDPTLTGRTRLWALVITAIKHRPLLGYGFESFWTGLKGESLNVIIGAGWLAPAAHNGFLELYLALGLLGSTVFVAAFLDSFRRAVTYIRDEPRLVAYWPVAFFCFFLVHNLGESDLITRCTDTLLTFIAVSTALAVRSGSTGNIVADVPLIGSYGDSVRLTAQ